MEDLDGIVDIARRMVQTYREVNGGKAGRLNVTVSVSNFVPKPHTPFQWFAQNTDCLLYTSLSLAGVDILFILYIIHIYNIQLIYGRRLKR